MNGLFMGAYISHPHTDGKISKYSSDYIWKFYYENYAIKSK